MDLLVKRLNPRVPVLKKAHPSDAGFDLYAADKPLLVRSQYSVAYKTGICVKIPDGYFGLVCERSSAIKKNVSLVGGVIDSGYTGEIIVQFRYHYSQKAINIYEIGDKIAQLVVIPIPSLEVHEVFDLPVTDRGIKGFGSTGA